MELLKWLDEENQNHLLSLIKHLKNGLSMEHSLPQTQVASIYKKGDIENLGNYRPITAAIILQSCRSFNAKKARSGVGQLELENAIRI